MTVNPDSKLKDNILIATTLIALASLILNFMQYKVSRTAQDFELASKYPSVDIYRLKLSVSDIKKIRLLAQQEGITFSHIPNPVFLQNDAVNAISDDEAIVEYLIIANDNDVSLSNLRFSHADTSLNDLEVNHLAAHNTLLIPETIQSASPNDAIALTTLFQMRYDFSLGGNQLDGIVLIPSPRAETIVFEAGLGPLALSTFTFEEE